MIDALLIFHFIGLMLGAGGGMGSAVAMGAANALPPEQAAPIRGIGPALVRMSLAGLVLMVGTGVALVVVKYSADWGAMPTMFHVKLLFVLTLTIAAVAMEMVYARVKKGDEKAAGLLPKLGPVAGVSSLLAVVFAVLAFH